MKNLYSILALGLVLLFSGCSTPRSVSELRGHGARRTYDAGYDAVWKAAVTAAQTGDLYILYSDKTKGFISARRGIRPETFGENVAIWVTGVAPTKTEVEVVSREAGPPVLMLRNWENRILDAVSADLSVQSLSDVR